MVSNTLSHELTIRSEVLVRTETVLFAVTNVVAVLGNLLTFYAVYRKRGLRTIPNMFVIALAVSDILMCTWCMPFTVASLFHGSWIFGETVCRFQAFDTFAFGMSSLGTMAAIAVSRYFRVVNQEKYPSLFKKRCTRSLIYIFMVWCLALAASVPMLLFKNGSIELQPGKAMCLNKFENSSGVTVWFLALTGSVPPIFFEGGTFDFQPGKAMCLYTFESNIAYTVFIECFYIATPLMIVTVCYVKVFRTVSRSNRVFSRENNLSQLRANVEEAKVTKTLVAVLVGFASCWLPISVMDNIDAARGEYTLPRQAYLTYTCLAYVSSTINPFIYGCMNKQFRRGYKVVFKKILCVRRWSSDSSSESGGRSFLTRAWSI
ncbi:melatonin receptor type 1A-like [Stylophora pistillata]|uniref:melatonin receptor type 1A-like n=1 Tax=Stylophora pistillata TaxID=50429 RepID=UPI000C04975B|nr:melatonin receptor type 1A-like [Stylophora pistillata]